MDRNPHFSNFNLHQSAFKFDSLENSKPVAASFIQNAFNLAEKFKFKHFLSLNFSKFASSWLFNYWCFDVIHYVMLKH